MCARVCVYLHVRKWASANTKIYKEIVLRTDYILRVNKKKEKKKKCFTFSFYIESYPIQGVECKGKIVQT